MPIKVDCSSCGNAFKAPSKYAGKKVKCPECKTPITIAAKSTKSPEAEDKPPATEKIAVKCACGQKFGAKTAWAGKSVKCPKCSEPVRIPTGKQSTALTKKKAGLPAKPGDVAPASEMGELFDEVGFNTEDGSAHRKCPECRSPMSDEAIICIDCGYNETTGKKMETYRPVTAEDRAKKASIHNSPDNSAAGKKKKRWFGF